MKLTGCNPPCSYVEYKLAGEPYKIDTKETRKLNIRFPSSYVLERTERMLYPPQSFVAEFGGALGLFLGFSFMMILDAVKVIMNTLKNH